MKNAKVSWTDQGENKQEGKVLSEYMDNGNTVYLVEKKDGELVHVFPKSVTLVFLEEEQK